MGLIWTADKLRQISLAWPAPSSGSSPVVFHVFRDGKEIATTSVPSYTDRAIAPGRTYVYLVSNTDSAGNASSPSDPLTITSLASDSATFVGVGDIAYEGPDDEMTAALVDKVVKESPDAVVFTAGDNAYPSGTDEEFRNFFEPTWGRHKQRMKPVPGNHDYRTEDGGPYYRYFGAVAGEAGKGYYSYDLGEWHMVALNSEIPIDDGSPEIDWLRKDLAANARPCTLAYFHKPRFSSGKGEGSNIKADVLWSTLYEFGVDVVVNGHQHSYERFGPQTPDGAPDPVHGIRQFVVGTGGVSLYDFLAPLPNSLVRNNSGFGIIKFTLDPSSYQWEFIPVDKGGFTDSGRENCSMTRPPTPPRRFEKAVSNSADDAMENAGSGAVNLTSTGVYLGAYGDGSPQIDGLRFRGIAVPPGAKIVSATLQFSPRDSGEAPTDVVIYGEAADDSPAFVDKARNLSGRQTTRASVAWSVEPWTDKPVAERVTPSLAAIVQEIVSRPGWASGNAMSFMIEGKGSRVARSFDFDRNDAPVLKIEFQPPPR